jgi:hypothetical protein
MARDPYNQGRDPGQVNRENHARMRHLEAPYLRTKEYLKSPEWQAKRDEILLRLSSALGLYRQGQDATAAVFVLGQAKQIVLEIQEVTDVITEFEDLRKRVKEYDERAG